MYVVTGATGKTGSVVARALLAKDEKVRVVGQNLEQMRCLVEAGAEPVVCDVTDADGLCRAFTNAQAVFAMIPPHFTSPDYRAYQECVVGSFARALASSGVKYAVSLSSIGADKCEKTGPVVGLHKFEERLNQISALNVVHLRAGYFMENTLAQIAVIKMAGVCGGPLLPELKLPMIAMRDIGEYAAKRLLLLDFTDRQTQELLGHRDLSMTEASAAIGRAIGEPDLPYVQIPDAQVRPALMHAGMSQNAADLILELSDALNSGHVRALEERNAVNTTPTSYEAFVTEEFLPAFHGRRTAA
ncbi:MAG TPA: NAD(P)H-binding protein [Terriglobales bacterium]|nr:NAD(P)H-binding protein [Terriglobales bacterium]